MVIFVMLCKRLPGRVAIQMDSDTGHIYSESPVACQCQVWSAFDNDWPNLLEPVVKKVVLKWL